MRLLLDTHSLLWFIMGSERLPLATRRLISDLDNQVWVSVASLWEIAIKTGMGRLTLIRRFDELIPEQLFLNRIEILPITVKDLSALVVLPFHHRDPFDRLIIAQAVTRSLVVVAKDREFSKYPIEIVW